MLSLAAVVVLFLLLCPLPMRVAGNAVVVPQHLVTVAAPMDGNVDKVYAHEGQRVAAGEVLGTINDWQWRANLAAAEAKYQQAMLADGKRSGPRQRAGRRRPRQCRLSAL